MTMTATGLLTLALLAYPAAPLCIDDEAPPRPGIPPCTEACDGSQPALEGEGCPPEAQRILETGAGPNGASDESQGSGAPGEEREQGEG